MDSNEQVLVQFQNEQTQQKRDLAFEEQAAELGVKAFAWGDWLNVSRESFQFQVIGEGEPKGGQCLDRSIDRDFQSLMSGLGHFKENNGMVTVIDHEGRVMIGYGTRQNQSALKEAGYTPGNIPVYFSNGEIPTAAHTKQKLDALIRRGRERAQVEQEAE